MKMKWELVYMKLGKSLGDSVKIFQQHILLFKNIKSEILNVSDYVKISFASFHIFIMFF